MSRTRLSSAILFAAAFAALLAALAHLHLHGFRSPENLDLQGLSLLTSGGQVSFRDVMISYPGAPLTAMVLLHWLLSPFGAYMPLALSALLGAALALAWFRSFRLAGLGAGVSLGAVALLGLNPLLLRAAAEGIGYLLPVCGTWLLAKGMLNLRRGSGVNDIMLISFSLVLLAASGPFGLVLVLATVPFLALIVSPELLAQSVSGVYLVFLFPLAFSASGFVFLNWMFTGDPLHFLASSGLGPLGVDRSAPQEGMPPEMAALAAAGMLLSSPLALWGLIRFRRFGAMSRGMAATLGPLILAVPLGWLFGVLPAPALAASMGCGLTAACVAAGARHRSLRSVILPALALGFIAGSLTVLFDHTTGAERWRMAALRDQAPSPDPTLARLGQALRGKHDILFDASAAPSAIAARGTAAGISDATSPTFQLAELTHRLHSRVVVVRSAESVHGADSLGRSFPNLYRDGAAGYRLVFDSPTWRVYQSEEEANP